LSYLKLPSCARTRRFTALFLRLRNGREANDRRSVEFMLTNLAVHLVRFSELAACGEGCREGSNGVLQSPQPQLMNDPYGGIWRSGHLKLSFRMNYDGGVCATRVVTLPEPDDRAVQLVGVLLGDLRRRGRTALALNDEVGEAAQRP
jgi:hypothetical protein